MVVEKAIYQGIAAVVDIYIYNNSSVNYILANQSKFTFHAESDIINLAAQQSTKISVKTLEQLNELVLNDFIWSALFMEAHVYLQIIWASSLRRTSRAHMI
ncbi:MAG: Sb-PDE family phosphodiesterase [Bacteroidota bacterium]